jgi:hypothetical protein
MRIIHSAAIAALLSCSLMTPVTPAYATVPEPTSAALNAMQLACDLAKPLDQQVITGSQSNPVVTNISYTASVKSYVGTALTPRVLVEPPVFVSAGSLTPISSTPPTYIPNSEVRRGGSPNIHGDFVATATFEGALFSQRTTTYARTSFSFVCSFNKITPGTTITDWKSEPSSIPHIDVAEGVVTNPEFRGPNVEQEHFSDGVICINPGNNRGNWRIQNSYTGGNCTGSNAVVTAYYLSLPAKFARSNSVPNYTPPVGNHGSTDENVSGSAFVNPVIDNDPDTISGTTAD